MTRLPRPFPAVLPVAVLFILALPALPILPLPDPLAAHWSSSRTPDGSLPRLAAAAVPAAVWAVVWALLHRSGYRRAGRRSAFTVGGILATVQAAVIAANLGASSWRDARSLSPLLLGLPLIGGLGLGWLAGTIGPPDPAGPPPTSAPPSSLELRDGERAVWVGRAVNRGIWAATAVLVIPAVVPMALDPQNDVPLVIAVGPIVVLAALFSSVRVVVGPEGVLAGLGPWGWPRRRFPMDQVRSATTDVVEPLDRGGWGYRLGLNGASLIVRRGDAMVLNLRDGAQFTVTVDGVADATRLVNAYARAG